MSDHAQCLPRRVMLLRRIGETIRGDWSGHYFDGRDVRDWIDTALDGDAAELAELASDLRAISRLYG